MLKKKTIIIACAAIAVMLVGGASAYFTSQDAATNTWTVGNVNIELLEPNYDAEGAENIVPNQILAKDPQVKNTGTNDAFVFMEFTIPKATVSIASEDGTLNTTALQELFNYTVDSGWIQVSNTSTGNGNTYVYAYAANDECIALSTDETTPAVFSDGAITFKNVVEGQLNASFSIPVNAYGIQTTNITQTNSTKPSEVWAVLSRHAGI